MTIRDMIMTAAGSGIPAGQRAYTAAGTFSFEVPSDTTTISVVCVGGGGGGSRSVSESFNYRMVSGAGGGGGALAYVNSIPVTPGEYLTVVVGAGGIASTSGTSGGDSYIARGATILCRAGGGGGSTVGIADPYSPTPAVAGTGGTVKVGSGGAGGAGNVGGGGAGGYAGAGGSVSGGCGGSGAGGTTIYEQFASSDRTTALGGSGGGGVGLLGQGTSGINAQFVSPKSYTGGGGGSGGSTADTTPGGMTPTPGALYGGGGGGAGWMLTYFYNSGTYSPVTTQGSNGVGGAVRIIWAGTTGITRAFPSTNTGNI